ncbi:hypothetical protein F4804DRAFT_63319 [Jackrogersella minutella]|nr:hypothetical protein F4804DRAFT_63319 [Jackrogersella minutella]
MSLVYLCTPVVRATVRRCTRSGNNLKWAGRGCRRYVWTPKKPPKKSPPPPSPPPKQQPSSPKPDPKSKSTPHPPPLSQSSSSSSPSLSSSKSKSKSKSKEYEDKRRPISELVRNRWFPLFGAGAAAVCIGFFTVSVLNYWRTNPAEHWTPGHEPETPTGRPSIQSPREFDEHLDKSEWRFGVTKLRRRIATEMARGHVLEVAVGTGRNFDYYDWSVVTRGLEPPGKEKEKKGWLGWLGNGGGEENGEKKGEPAKPSLPQVRLPPKENAILSFTGVDISPPMLNLALTRIRQVVPYMDADIPKNPSFTMLASAAAPSSPSAICLARNKIRLFKSDAQTPPLPASPSASGSEKYDTIIQTFGLCSVRDPVQLLSTMAEAVVPDTGRIVLLEHGRSWWELVNGMLDRSARQHFERFGCWWNRDVELVVRAAERAVPGLEVLRLDRPGWATMGTHVLVEMRVRGDAAAAAAAADTAGAAGAAGKEDEPQKETTGWWSSLLLSVRSKSDTPKKDD